MAVAGLLGELGYPATTELAAELLAVFAADPRSRVQVAVVDGDVAGLVATHVVPRLDADRRSCRVVDLVVAADHRRAGAGAALIAAAETEARRQDCSRLDLSSAEAREDAHAFYARIGFDAISSGFVKRLR